MVARITMVRAARLVIAAALFAGASAQRLAAAGPSRQALEVFHKYVAQAETQIRQAESSPEKFLGLSTFPAPNPGYLKTRLRRGEIVITSGGITPVEVPGGLIHHWIGIVFIPQATIPRVLAVLQNYDGIAKYYSPDVAASRLIKHHGDDFEISMRLREHKVITVMLDGLYDVKYGRLDDTHQFSTSHSLQLVEVADANSAESTDPPPPSGHDHGFLWRTNAYWRFEQADDGVFVEFESISLSRNVPTGLGWLVEPFIREIPRESLQFTLRATRKAVLATMSASEQQPLSLAHRP